MVPHVPLGLVQVADKTQQFVCFSDHLCCSLFTSGSCSRPNNCRQWSSLKCGIRRNRSFGRKVKYVLGHPCSEVHGFGNPCGSRVGVQAGTGRVGTSGTRCIPVPSR